MIIKIKEKLWKRVAKIIRRGAKFKKRLISWFYTSLVRYSAVSCGKDLHVNSRSIFEGKCYFGSNCNFNGMIVKGGGSVVFGNNFHSGENCKIITDNHNYDGGAKIPYDDTYIFKKVIIEDNVWFCDNVVVVGDVTIGEGAIIAAGSVVAKNVPKCAIVGGNPARIIKYRDILHYDLLKSQNAFH